MRKVIFLSLVSVLFVFSSLHSVGQKPPSGENLPDLPSIWPKHEPPDSGFLYLDIDEGYYHQRGLHTHPYEINTTEEIGNSSQRDSVSNCEIMPQDNLSIKRMICILNIEEWDLINWKSKEHLALTLNVPKGMCSLLITEPAWHWNTKPKGTGSQRLHMRTWPYKLAFL